MATFDLAVAGVAVLGFTGLDFAGLGFAARTFARAGLFDRDDPVLDLFFRRTFRAACFLADFFFFSAVLLPLFLVFLLFFGLDFDFLAMMKMLEQDQGL